MKSLALAKALVPKNKVGKALCIGSMILRWPVTWKGCSDVSAEAGFADPAWGARSSPKSQKGATLKIHFCINHTCRNSEIIHAFCKCCLSEALIRTSSDLLACFSLHQNLGSWWKLYDDALLQRHWAWANRDSARSRRETDDSTWRMFSGSADSFLPATACYDTDYLTARQEAEH